MKNFNHKQFSLSECRRDYKLIYTFFLLFCLLGYFTLALINFSRIGFGYKNIVTYYRGSPVEEEMRFPKTFNQLLELTHFHAFSEAIILLILAHLFLGTSLSLKVKYLLVSALFSFSLLELFSPWLIRYLAPQFAFLQIVSLGGIYSTVLPMIFISLYETWFV